MASLVPKVNKEKLARKVTLVPPVLRAPLELLGLRWVKLSSPGADPQDREAGCRRRGLGRPRAAGRPGCCSRGGGQRLQEGGVCTQG